jgi:phosphoribosylamine--glycine ligase
MSVWTLMARSLHFHRRIHLCVVLASAGYPAQYEKGKLIHGLPPSSDPDLMVYHAGTQVHPQGIATAGGRVLGVTALGKDIPTAIDNAYGAVKTIHWNGVHYRTDIGKRPE